MLVSNDIKIRRASATDNVAEIAKLLYLTDPYIYPCLCADATDKIWIDFVSRALKSPNHVHCAQNMLLATQSDEIVGLICAYPVPSDRTFLLPMRDDVMHKYGLVWEGYYKHSQTHANGLYISNLCVDPPCRHKGIGGALLKALIDEHPYETISLDVICDNVEAVSLYERAGFEAGSVYDGFSGESDCAVKCLTMTKKPAANL